MNSFSFDMGVPITRAQLTISVRIWIEVLEPKESAANSVFDTGHEHLVVSNQPG